MSKLSLRQERLKNILGLTGDDWEDQLREVLSTTTQWTQDCIEAFYFGKDVETPCAEDRQYAATARFTARRVIREKLWKRSK